MNARRHTPYALAVACLLLIPASASWAQTTCVPMITCPSDNTKAAMRQPYSSKTWFVSTMPGSPHSDRIYLLNDDVVSHVQGAMRTYSNLDLAVPYDYTSTTSGDVTFAWGWVPSSDIQSDPNRRTGVAGAAMAWQITDCVMTYNVAKFAYNPTDGVRLMCWTGEWCNPPWCATPACGDTTNLDYKSAAVHEYGHALGLNHSTTSGATMQTSMTTQDSTGRLLLACEANRVVKAYHDNNPAASIIGYSVRQDGGQSIVSWTAEQEASTAKYQLEHGPDWNGPFTLITEIPVNPTGTYAVNVPANQSGYYRLVEIETDDDVLAHWTEPAMPTGSTPEFVQQSVNFDSTVTAILAPRARIDQALTGQTEYIIYTPAAFAPAFQALADAYTGWLGVPTELVTHESIGGPAAIKAHIAANLPLGGYVLKVGDAWEGFDVFGQSWRGNPELYQNNGFTVDQNPAQPSLNISPLTYRRELAHQTVAMSNWTPFVATPWHDVDHDNDGLPDPGYFLGFAPISTQTEAEVFVVKAMQQMFTVANPPGNMMPPAALMTYARNYAENSGAIAKARADSLVAGLHATNAHLSVVHVATTDANPLSTAQRNAAFKAQLDAGRSSITFMSTVSQHYQLGAYAHVDIPGYYFDVNALSSHGILAFGIGITCGLGFDRTESSIGTPVTERLLFVPNRGFWGYFGPNRGSFQEGNYRIGQIFHRRQYRTPPGELPPTVGQLATETVREAAAFKPDSLLAISYLLVGDPRGRIPSPGYSVVSVEPTTMADRPLSVTPNPTLGAARFSFALAKPSRVDLAVYDIAGRRVASIIESELPAGSHQVAWSNPSDRHRTARSGVYLARLRVGDRTWNQKFVIVH